MSQNELQPLHYRKAYALLIARVEQVIAQLECGGEDVPPGVYLCRTGAGAARSGGCCVCALTIAHVVFLCPSAVLWGGIFAVISRLHGAKDRLHAARPEGSK